MHAICSKQECYGCSACHNICPTGCISMVPDEEGFSYPIINQTECTDCEECVSVCQVHNEVISSAHNQRYFAAKNSDEVRVNSSSGGMFTAVSDHVLANDGVIVGAALNSDFTVSHIIARNAGTRDLLRGSKYVQSDLKELYSELQEVLSDSKQVLFVGTPCQVAGLKLFLGKNYENLITCDLVCRGVPSPRVFRSFIEYVQEKGGDALTEFKFRDKKLGWRGYTVSTQYANGKKKHVALNTLWLRSFHYLFIHNFINRPSCSRCKHASYERCSDITLGDYWAVKKYYPQFEDRLGVSLVITNTGKGEQVFQSISPGLVHVEIGRQEAKQNALSTLPRPNNQREAFWDCYNTGSYEMAIKRFGEFNSKGFIKDVARNIMNIPRALPKTRPIA